MKSPSHTWTFYAILIPLPPPPARRGHNHHMTSDLVSVLHTRIHITILYLHSLSFPCGPCLKKSLLSLDIQSRYCTSHTYRLHHIPAFLDIPCDPHSFSAPACRNLHLHMISDLISILHTHVYIAITYLHSLSFHTILIPLLPPPAKALTITGYPISLVYFTHVSMHHHIPAFLVIPWDTNSLAAPCLWEPSLSHDIRSRYHTSTCIGIT